MATFIPHKTKIKPMGHTKYFPCKQVHFYGLQRFRLYLPQERSGINQLRINDYLKKQDWRLNVRNFFNLCLTGESNQAEPIRCEDDVNNLSSDYCIFKIVLSIFLHLFTAALLSVLVGLSLPSLTYCYVVSLIAGSKTGAYAVVLGVGAILGKSSGSVM